MSETQSTTDSPERAASKSQSSWGCLSILGLSVVIGGIALLLILAASVGGFGSYYVARYFEFEPVRSGTAGAVCGALAAVIGAIAGPPAGWLLSFVGDADSRTARVVTAAIVALLSPFLHFEILILSAVIGAIGGVFASNVSDPSKAAILIAIGAPLVGFFLGAGQGTPPSVHNDA